MNEDAASCSKRSVFFISDGTGITAETFGRSLLTQFEGVAFQNTSLPFVDTAEKAAQAVAQINGAARRDGCRPLVFATFINHGMRELIANSDGLLLELFDTFTPILEQELGLTASHVAGRSHGITDYSAYTSRIGALNFALNSDDGATTRNYDLADIIITGVSRCGKTPTCLYLALRFGIHAANYPITEEDFDSEHLPVALKPYRDKLFGLTIQPERLQQIRRERRPDSRYASLAQCRKEVAFVESVYRNERIRFIDTTQMSVEEIATTIMSQAGLKRLI